MAWQEKISVRGYALTLFPAALSIIASGSQRLTDLLVYDRQAILDGELWRLVTAPLVHFSASHLFWDVLVFSVAGFAIEAAGFSGFALVCGFAAITPSLLFLAADPELARWGGLSGLATGALAYFCLCQALRTGKSRAVWLGILVVMGVKILVELATGTPIFVRAEAQQPFRTLPSVHILGYLAAVIPFFWSRVRNLFT